jgi:hypothetical protein
MKTGPWRTGITSVKLIPWTYFSLPALSKFAKIR